MTRTRSSVLLTVLGAVLALSAVAPAVAAADQTPARTEGGGDAPAPADRAAASVSLTPRDARPDDPNGGAWFVLTLDPGASDRAVASVTNPADTPVVVSLSLRDLDFTEDGTPELGSADDGIAQWGGFEADEIEVPAGATVQAAFQLTVPSGTPPGDHIGAAVAATRHVDGDTEIIHQVATRVIVTVPGDAARSLEITSVGFEHTAGLVPGALVGRVTVRNTGSIRLAPRVTVAGQDAAGPRFLTAESSETYVAEIPVSPLGGLVRLPVVVADASGLTRQIEESTFVMPWWLLIVALLAVGAAVALRQRRRTPLDDVRADVRRLERLVIDVQRRLDGLVATGLPESRPAGATDPVHALEASVARARRAGEDEVFAALALALHEATGDARGVVAEAAALPTSYREELLRVSAELAEPAEDPTSGASPVRTR